MGKKEIEGNFEQMKKMLGVTEEDTVAHRELTEEKEVDYGTCGFCTEYDCDNSYCPHRGTMYEKDTCDGFTPEAELLTEEEMKDIKGDMEAHRIMVEGEIME